MSYVCIKLTVASGNGKQRTQLFVFGLPNEITRDRLRGKQISIICAKAFGKSEIIYSLSANDRYAIRKIFSQTNIGWTQKHAFVNSAADFLSALIDFWLQSNKCIFIESIALLLALTLSISVRLNPAFSLSWYSWCTFHVSLPWN